MCTRCAKRPRLASVGIVGTFIQTTSVNSSQYDACNSAPRSRSQGAATAAKNRFAPGRGSVDYLHDGHNYHDIYRNDQKHRKGNTNAGFVDGSPGRTRHDIKIDATAADDPAPSHDPDAKASLRAYGRALLLAAASHCLVIWFVSTASSGAGWAWHYPSLIQAAFSLLRIAIILFRASVTTAVDDFSQPQLL
ncbi:hypothetical protein DL764_007633 [Monosporascus ibericus]|uniref:Uncharacterized protein n=1 Tax=Monosporascus ibericus TaxID=155417 RepID=A0A4Q4SZJ4_9PEZI|nr:hypothetical protein DL764_007633 [Monosporascus ibericus]